MNLQKCGLDVCKHVFIAHQVQTALTHINLDKKEEKFR